MKHSNYTTESFSETFKPAILLGRPTFAEWENNFFLTQFQESRDPDGRHALFLSGQSINTEETQNLYSVRTPVPGEQTHFRQVEVVDRSRYTAFAINAGIGEPGVFILMMQVAEGKQGQPETHFNSRLIPHASLSDLVKGVTDEGLLKIEIPKTGIVKLNTTLRTTPAGEPEFRTHKTEVLIEGTTDDQRQEVTNRLNLVASNVIAAAGSDLLKTLNYWPVPSQSDALLKVEANVVVAWASYGLLALGVVVSAIGAGVGAVGVGATGGVLMLSGVGVSTIYNNITQGRLNQTQLGDLENQNAGNGQ